MLIFSQTQMMAVVGLGDHLPPRRNINSDLLQTELVVSQILIDLAAVDR